ncbi:30S ribosomal protein S8 [Candidatus Woesearchaeota archaeon]|nr:30S ribosomal protein S8 [Candidatus Woesearchaeota archaeon]MBW3021515.1 30S ribosomal protein S8 [Candidatus Woesearchaeota archaeon]
MLNDPLANALSKILNAERVGKVSCKIKPVSNVLKKILTLLKEKMFIGEFKEVDDGKGGFIELNLLGKINNCGAIKPRYPLKLGDFEKFEKRYLPAKDFGIIVVSTSKGIMSHIEAKEKGIGGKLIAYIY